MMRRATRYFSTKKEARQFAREVTSAELAEIERWNPMREFGYRFEVRYDADSLKEDI